MSTTQSNISVPFLDEMRQKWQSGAMTTDEVLAQVLDWEDDVTLRSNEELDEAWAFRQEVEGSGGLKSASDLQYLLDSSAEHHIDDVLDDLKEIANRSRLGDSYARVIETILAEGGPRHRREIRQMLSQITNPEPKLQAILTDLTGGTAAIPGDEEEEEGDTEEEDPTASAASTAGTGSTGPAQGASQPSGSAKTPKSSQDPWLATQRFITLGRWEEARKAVDRIPVDHPRADEIPNILAAIDEGEVYDQVPGLRPMLGALASSRSRRDWVEFKRRRGEAEKYVTDASAQAGRPIPVPKSLRDIFDEALKAQDAEALVEKAIQQRERGDFPGAATSLADALTLDPRFARVQSEQQLTTDLQNLLYTLRRSPLNGAHELADALAIAEQILEPSAAPGSVEASTKRDTVLGKIDNLVTNTRRRIEGRHRAIQDPGNLDDKLSVCDAIAKHLDEIEILRKDDPDLEDQRDWLDATRRTLTELLAERNELTKYVATLVPGARIDAAVAENWMRRLDTLINEPLAQSDAATRTLAQSFTGKLTSYLDDILQPGRPADLPTVENCAEVLRLAQSSPRGLPLQQSTAYNRAIWGSGALLVRSLLPKTLPPYQPPQPGMAFTPRSEEIIGQWDQARQVLEWLRNLPNAHVEQQTIEALERDFALSVNQTMESAATLPRKITREESDERVATARSIKQYVQTLPVSIRDKIAPQVLTSKRTQTESSMRRRKTISVLIPALLILLLLSIATAVGIAVNNNVTSANATATAVAQVASATAAVQATQTEVRVIAVATEEARRVEHRDDWMDAYLTPEPNANNLDCTFVATVGDNGFNICDAGGVHFKEYYGRTGWAQFLGAPISKMFPDRNQQDKWVQYFERGRLEQGTFNGVPRAEFGTIGYAVFTQVFGDFADGTGIRSEDSGTAISPDWGSVPGFTPKIRTTHGFLDFYTSNLGAKGSWNPMDYYGAPVTREYQVGDKQIFRQFFERAILEWREGGKVEALPVGKIYLKLVRYRNIELPDDYVTGLGQQ